MSTISKLHIARVILAAGLVIAVVDMINAMTYWRLLYGTPPVRILQSIASGLLGRAAFTDDAWTAWLGAGLHLFIACTMAAVYIVASRSLRFLNAHPWRSGAVYGLCTYLTMRFVVLPLSEVPPSAHTDIAWVADSIITHLVLVGWFVSWVARKI